MNITSEWKYINGKPADVFHFVSDLSNLGSLMPEQVVNWQATSETCSFTIKGMTDLKLKINEKRQPTFMRLIPDGKSPMEFELLFHVREAGNSTSGARIEMNADLNPMLALMAKKPLQNLVNVIVDKLSAQKF